MVANKEAEVRRFKTSQGKMTKIATCQIGLRKANFFCIEVNRIPES